MSKFRKILKDPMFIGLAAGCMAGFTILILDFTGDDEALRLVLITTCPLHSGYIVSHSIRALWLVDIHLVLWVVCSVWYLQCGFFAGLLYKLARKRYSGKLAALILGVATIVLGTIMLSTNYRYWQDPW